MLATIGIVPGETFDQAKLDPTVAKGLEKTLPVALAKLTARRGKPSVAMTREVTAPSRTVATKAP